MIDELETENSDLEEENAAMIEEIENLRNQVAELEKYKDGVLALGL